LLTEWQTADARNDRERISRVRQVAEDLFKPRQQTVSADVPTSAPDVASSPEHQPRRQPRIFAIPPQRPISTSKVEPPAEPKPIRRKAAIMRESLEIPAAQLGRVRALTNYGMTQQQVAELYARSRLFPIAGGMAGGGRRVANDHGPGDLASK
jgi:hypothetical protein